MGAETGGQRMPEAEAVQVCRSWPPRRCGPGHAGGDPGAGVPPPWRFLPVLLSSRTEPKLTRRTRGQRHQRIHEGSVSRELLIITSD